MRTIFDGRDREALVARLRSIPPDRPGLWGRMTAPRMVCHLGDQVRCALGDIPTRVRPNFLRNRPLRYLFVHLLPWPKGVPTVPEMQSSVPETWKEDLESLEVLLRRAADRGPSAPWADHPAFGPLPGREWGWIIHKHVDHHLRQFGA